MANLMNQANTFGRFVFGKKLTDANATWQFIPMRIESSMYVCERTRVERATRIS